MKRKYIHILIVLLFVALFLSIASFSNSITVHTNKKEIENKNIDYITKEDIIKPDIYLNEGEIEITLGEDYIEPGYYAIDNTDGDITALVEIETNFNKNKIGDYEIRYSISDSSGNNNQAIRKVKVTSKIIRYSNTITDNEELNNRINDLKNYLDNYNISIGYINLKTNFTFLYKENTNYFGASLIKTLDAMYVYENNIYDKDIREKVKLAISKSDNSAHNYIVNKIKYKTTT
ncbi:MAG: DUF5011 domain-containing protein [Bacilli bacterium]|nr:DUF5011 domain-containing protein [Bacilli bacterium]